jgi:protein gp37
LIFLIITKRVDRIAKCLPSDWGDGYDNVIICVTAENQKRADERIPVLLDLPVKHKWVTCTPLLEPINLEPYLKTGQIEFVEVSGEKSCVMPARPTKYEWVEDLYKQCVKHDVRFYLIYLGHHFVMPDGTVRENWARWCRSEEADSLGLINYKPITFKLKDSTIMY